MNEGPTVESARGARVVSRWPQIAAGLAVALGLLVIVGWWAGVPALTRILPGWATMKFNTAACFALSGAALWMTSATGRWAKLRWLGRFVGLMVVAVGLATLLQDILHTDFGIDQLLLSDTQSGTAVGTPGRMSGATAIGFMLLGLSVCLLRREDRGGLPASLVLALVVLICGVMGLAGYVYSPVVLRHLTLFETVALHTTVLFVVLSLGVLQADSGGGALGVLTRDSQGGWMARRFLPVAIAVPLLFGALGRLAARSGWYEDVVGDAIAMTAVSVVLVVGVWLIALWLDRANAARELAERRLVESLTELTALRDGIDKHAIVVMTDQTGHILSVNMAYQELTGYTEEKILQAPTLLVDPSLQTPGEATMPTDAMARKRTWQGEFRSVDAQGESLWFSATAVPYAAHGEMHYLFILANVTARRQAEEAERQNVRQFRAMSESMPTIVWTCEPSGECDYLSPQWEAYTGVPVAEHLGYGWLAQIHPDDQARTQSEWQASAESLTPLDTEYRLRRHDGEYRWFKIRAVPLIGDDGELEKWYGTNTDVQDLRDSQESLQTLNQDLEARVEERTAELAAAIESLREVSDMLGAAQAIAHLGSWEFDPVSGRVRWSDELFHIVGLDPSEEPPNYAEQEQMFTPDSWRRLGEAVTRATTKGEGYELELQIIRPDGERRWAVARASTVMDETGAVTQLVGTFQDITDLKQAKEDLDLAYERSSLATTAAGIGVWDWDVVENVLVWDSTMYGLYGVSEDAFSSAYEAWRATLHPDDLADGEKAVQLALSGERNFDVSFRVLRGDGQIRYLRGVAIVKRDETGAPLRMVGVNWDETAQREAESRLQASEKLLREFVSHAPAAIAMFDTQMRYLQASQQWRIDYNLGDVELVGRDCYEVVPDMPAHWREMHQRVLQGMIESRADDAYIRADGALDWVEWEARPWYTGTGDVGGLLFFTRLITETKAMHKTLLDQQTELLRSNAELEQFAYVASHDLQEPLRAVSSCAQIFASSYSDAVDDDGRELIGHMVEGAGRMQSLIEDLLAFSRVGSRDLDLHDADSRAALDLAMTQLEVSIAESEAAITIGDLPVVRADAKQLTQLWQNLVGNAIKYRGGEPLAIQIDATVSDGVCTFSVADNGIGIEDRFFDRIFIAFKRLHTRDEYKGTGIGLAICKKIVERHGGTLWLESELGRGTTFFFTLPTGAES